MNETKETNVIFPLSKDCNELAVKELAELKIEIESYLDFVTRILRQRLQK